jgi:excisionase family DNA binding protein
MSVVNLEELAALPEVVARLQQRVEELEARLVTPANDTEELLDAPAAGKVLGMTASAVRQAAYRGSIPAVKVGRRLRFRRSDLPR